MVYLWQMEQSEFSSKTEHQQSLLHSRFVPPSFLLNMCCLLFSMYKPFWYMFIIYTAVSQGTKQQRKQKTLQLI